MKNILDFDFKQLIFLLKVWIRRAIYFSFFCFVFWIIVYSNYGLIDYFSYRAEKQQLRIELEKLQKEKAELICKVNEIGEEIDVDLLEMEVRNVLCYAREGESIYCWR